MKQDESDRLTRIMRDEGILRISNTDLGFSVYLTGDIWATGSTVGEAYHNALNQRAVRDRREAA